MNNATILQTIYSHAQIKGNKVALISDGNEVRYAELIGKINLASSFLKEKGVCAHDYIILSADKKLDFVYLYFAIHLLKAVCVPVDRESNQQRLKYIVNSVRPKLILGCLQGLQSISYEEILYSKKNESFERMLHSQDMSEICDVLFTTGTTGNPKGVRLSHSNELAAAVNINNFIQNTDNDIELLALPICHSFGLGRLRCCLYKGATLILLDGFANLHRVFQTMKKYHVSGFSMVPSVWNYIKKFSGVRIGHFANQIKYIEIGSAPMSLENKRLLMRIFPNTKICMHYGLTEASRSTFIEFHRDADFLNSIGKVAPNVEIKFYDESGHEVRNGAEGELCVSGEHVMVDYFSAEDNRNCHYGNYFRTGDWGYADSYGYFYLVGRKKELINVGGKKVSPLELENIIVRLPGIEDCVCIGIPDPNGILGEVVKCYLQKKVNAALYSIVELRNELKDKIETYKLPVEIEYVMKMPYTVSGKKQRLLMGKTNE